MPCCRHCGDDLPDDCPADVTSCRSYAAWRAREAGDMLPEGEARTLELYAGMCELWVATRDGLDVLPHLD